MKKTIGETLRDARKRKGITQLDIAKILGTTQQNIQRYEKNLISNIPLENKFKLANILEIDIATILTDAEIEQQKTMQQYLKYIFSGSVIIDRALLDKQTADLLQMLDNGEPLANYILCHVSQFASYNEFVRAKKLIEIMQEPPTNIIREIGKIVPAVSDPDEPTAPED